MLSTGPRTPPLLPKPIGPEIDEEFWHTLLGPEHLRPEPAPLADPDLPAGISHLWLASTLSGRGALHWSADGGWERTGWRTPEDEDAIDATTGATAPAGTSSWSDRHRLRAMNDAGRDALQWLTVDELAARRRQLVRDYDRELRRAEPDHDRVAAIWADADAIT